MKRFVTIIGAIVLPCLLCAQQILRVSHLSPQLLPAINQDWDAGRIYRQMVVLVSFVDCDFQVDDPRGFYHRLFNEEGFVQRKGAGSVSDYFRHQSNGQLNLEFDVYGPMKVSLSAAYGNGVDTNWGGSAFYESLQLLSAQEPAIDYSPYDWDGDGYIEQIVFVYAGYAGNQAGLTAHIWPNTDEMREFHFPDGHSAYKYSASGELWSNNTSCGVGTICHEYSHCLGLPDLYPTSIRVTYASVLDEWDLMDSGNLSNLGSCPPNYSAVEKMLLGWLEPVALTKDTVITNLKPVAEGGEAFIIHHTDNEYYLLENRQWEGWDAALPGRGLLVWHVNYKKSNWSVNSVNNTEGRPDCHLMTADNLNYSEWRELYFSRGGGSRYRDAANRMNSCIMSSAAYPWTTDSTSFVNNSLTDTSIPASVMYNNNAQGSNLLSKPITDICQNADGMISFTFHASNSSSGIVNLETSKNDQNVIYDLQGNRMSNASQLRPGIYIVNGKKVVVARK